MSLPKNATIAARPFKIAILESQLSDLKTLLRISKLPPATYEGTKEQYGVTSEWMRETKHYWENIFNWREHEAKINKLPQFTAPVKSKDGAEHTLHFIGIFSERENAIPLVLLHGWPGSFVEFLDLIPILAVSTSPHFHIIVPSLPGYAFSSTPPLDKDFTFQDAAYLVNELMVGLGLKKYVAQGGDIGSFVSQTLATGYSDCRGCHINMLQILNPPSGHPLSSLSSADQLSILRGQKFRTTGIAYALEHATRPSTIGHVLASSPLALLAWIGEKLCDWTDTTPPIKKILEIVTLWWFTETMPRSIYAYRHIFIEETRNMSGTDLKGIPFGFSNFPKEILPAPKPWAESLGDMIFYKGHDRGGHFAAMEVPELLAEDVKSYVNTLVKGGHVKKA